MPGTVGGHYRWTSRSSDPAARAEHRFVGMFTDAVIVREPSCMIVGKAEAGSSKAWQGTQSPIAEAILVEHSRNSQMHVSIRRKHEHNALQPAWLQASGGDNLNR